ECMSTRAVNFSPRTVFIRSRFTCLVCCEQNVLITVNQEYQGVYLKTFNLITRYNTDRQYVSEAAMNLIPPFALTELPDNKLTFSVKECEKGDVVKFVYVLRAGWDIDNSRSTIEKQHVLSDPGCKVLCVHKFTGDNFPSLVVSRNGRVFRFILDLESDVVRNNPNGMYRLRFGDDRLLAAMICKGEDYVIVDDELSKFVRRRGAHFDAPISDRLIKRAVNMQIELNRVQFFVAVNREELYAVNERASRFTKIPLPERRLMGAGLVFNDNDDLILTDKEGLNPAPHRLPSRGIPSLQTISCLKVVSMSPEETLFHSREVG
ncbi:hypothetical protein PMAYCL1PPCAC_06237, partial [Pristionchus mayeri]